MELVLVEWPDQHMPEQRPDDLIKCRYCGRMTSPKANFCYYCTRELVTRPERPAEEPRRMQVNWLLYGAAIGAILIILLYFLLRTH
jgi:hypothetical protein